MIESPSFKKNFWRGAMRWFTLYMRTEEDVKVWLCVRERESRKKCNAMNECSRQGWSVSARYQSVHMSSSLWYNNTVVCG